MSVVWRIDKEGRFYRYVFKRGSLVRFYAKNNELPDDYAGVVLADTSLFSIPKSKSF